MRMVRANFDRGEPGAKRENRGGRIRTCDLSVPNRAHYQAVLRPETETAKLVVQITSAAPADSSHRVGRGSRTGRKSFRQM